MQGAGCRVQGVGAQSNDDQEVQWNLSIEDTIGTQLAVLYREVSLIQRQICTQLYVFGTTFSVLIREVSFFQSVFHREVALYLEELDHETQNGAKC